VTAAISSGVAVVEIHGPLHDRLGLQRALRARGLDAVRVTGTAEQAVRHACDAGAGGVVVEGELGAAALRAVADAGDRRLDFSVVVVGPTEPELDVLVALASGVGGYLPDHARPAAVADAVVDVLAGDIVAPRRVTGPLVHGLRTSSRGTTVPWTNGRPVEVTAREWEVLVLLRQGRSTREMAGRLVVAPVTVRTHVAALVEKFDVRGRAELARPG